MSSLLKTMLFRKVPNFQSVGRSIKFDVSDIDIRFSTGTMRERVVGYMSVRGEPLTAKEIAQGIGSNTSRVYLQLQRLVTEKHIEVINIDGSHPEYSLLLKKGMKL